MGYLVASSSISNSANSSGAPQVPQRQLGNRPNGEPASAWCALELSPIVAHRCLPCQDSLQSPCPLDVLFDNQVQHVVAFLLLVPYASFAFPLRTTPLGARKRCRHHLLVERHGQPFSHSSVLFVDTFCNRHCQSASTHHNEEPSTQATSTSNSRSRPKRALAQP